MPTKPIAYFAYAVPIIGLIGGIHWCRQDSMSWWLFAMFYLGAMGWGYARGKA